MYVCICRAVTDSAIRRAIDEGANTIAELGRRTGAGTQCGSCVSMTREILDEALETRRAQPGPVPLRVVGARSPAV